MFGDSSTWTSIVSGVGTQVTAWIGALGPLIETIVAVGIFAIVFGIIVSWRKS